MSKKILVLALASLVALSCTKDTHGGETEVPQEYALDVYWDADYTGKYGIHVSDGQRPKMLLADIPMYVTGVNCYNLFLQTVNASMNTADMESTVKVFVDEEVPVVRFAGIVYYADEMSYYTDKKEAYFANLKKLAELCDQANILLIPSVFWQIATLPDYFDEHISAWGNTKSQTYKFMIEYTKELVNLLKDHKCIAAWEFGNEFNLAADIAIAGYPDISASAIGVALKGFADTVKSLDPHGRLISSGHSVMRNAQWHLAYDRTWDLDSFSEYVEMTGVMTPDPMQGMSEHIYEEPRQFSDLGKLDRRGQIEQSMNAAAQLNKVFYVGEFTGPSGGTSASLIQDHYDTYYEKGVQLSLIWNYAYLGNIEHSFKAFTRESSIAFGCMRKLNDKYRSPAK